MLKVNNLSGFGRFRSPLIVPSGGGGFNPTSISNILSWHAARLESYSNNDLIPIFHDWSGNGNTATQSNPSAQATFLTSIVNGLPAFGFIINTNAAYGTLLTLNNPFSIILVETGYSDSGQNQRTVTAISNNALMSFGRTTQNQIYNNGAVYGNGSAPILGPGIGVLTVGSVSRFVFAGVDITTGTTFTGDWGQLSYGALNPYSEIAYTNLLECVIYGKVLSDSEMNYLGNGFSALYGYSWTDI